MEKLNQSIKQKLRCDPISNLFYLHKVFCSALTPIVQPDPLFLAIVSEELHLPENSKGQTQNPNMTKV